MNTTPTKLHPASSTTPGVVTNLQKQFVQLANGSLRSTHLLNVPGANRQERKAWIKAQKRANQKTMKTAQ